MNEESEYSEFVTSSKMDDKMVKAWRQAQMGIEHMEGLMAFQYEGTDGIVEQKFELTETMWNCLQNRHEEGKRIGLRVETDESATDFSEDLLGRLFPDGIDVFPFSYRHTPKCGEDCEPIRLKLCRHCGSVFIDKWTNPE